ncbi:hypothetical protein AAC387_Pa11g0033 [Persea americana]
MQSFADFLCLTYRNMDNIPSDATKGASKKYEERKDHLLSQIFHVVSNYSSIEAGIKRLARAFHETIGAETDKHLSEAQHEKTEAENRFIHLMEEKNATEKELNQAKEELNDLKLMYSRICSDYMKIYDEVEHWYEGVVAHRQELEHWYEALVALLDNSGSVMVYRSSDRSVEGLSQGRINCLVEEKEELEKRLTSLIEQNVSNQRRAIESFTALEKERRKLISECNNHKECIGKLKLEYEQVIHEKCALQGDLDFLKKDLATREENEERISSEVVELKRRNKDLVQELKSVRGKKLDADIALSVCICFIAWCMGLGLGKAFILLILISSSAWLKSTRSAGLWV